jgi:CRP-like cAMP-binding protein
MDAQGMESPSASVAAPAMEDMLAGFALLAVLTREDLQRLARGAVHHSAPCGQILFRQGDSCSGLRLILKGRVKLSVDTVRGEEKVIALIGAGGSLGEVPLLLGQPHRLTAEVVADASIIELGAQIILEQIAQNVHFVRSALRDVCLRLVERTRDLENCMVLNGRQRVADFLLSQLPAGVAPAALPAVTLPVKNSIIASRLNLTQEHFSRILHELQVAGLIEVRGRQIRLLDVARMRYSPHED